VQWTIFAVVAASYLLSYFHRLAPAAISSDLTQSFAINDTTLGSLAAVYFYVHTLMQVPTGVLTDTLGPRKILSLGAGVTGVGCVVFAMAANWEFAAVGRLLVGLGTSVTFIAFLKLNAAWFAEQRFASIAGLTIMIGNFGAVFGASPLAWVVETLGWRTVFVWLGVLSIALLALTWAVVRNRPEEAGFILPANSTQPVSTSEPRPTWVDGLKEVVRNRQTWPGFWINLGICGTFFCFSGLWAVPYLMDVYGYSRVLASNHTTLLLFGVALGALCIGRVSDRLQNRKKVMLFFGGAYVLTWLPLVFGQHLPLFATLGLFFVMGFVIPSYTLTWSMAKEINNPTFSGIATSVVNVGCFLGAGIMQPLIGWILDSVPPGDGLLAGYRSATFVLFGFTVLGFLAMMFLRETHARNQWKAPTGSPVPA
jgi:predicted MFS family arabinose efflux permease